jgi:hypothetical protein
MNQELLKTEASLTENAETRLSFLWDLHNAVNVCKCSKAPAGIFLCRTNPIRHPSSHFLCHAQRSSQVVSATETSLSFGDRSRVVIRVHLWKIKAADFYSVSSKRNRRISSLMHKQLTFFRKQPGQSHCQTSRCFSVDMREAPTLVGYLEIDRKSQRCLSSLSCCVGNAEMLSSPVSFVMPTRNADWNEVEKAVLAERRSARHSRLPPRWWTLGTARIAVAAATVATAIGGSAATIAAAATEAATTTVARAAAIAAAIGRSAAHATWGTTHITGRTATSATATTTTTAATTAKAGALTSDVLEEAGDILVSLLQELDEVANDTTVATVEEGSRETSVTSTASATNTVDIVINIGGKVVVDDVGLWSC